MRNFRNSIGTFAFRRLFGIGFLAALSLPAAAAISVQGLKASSNFDFTYLEAARFDRLADGARALRYFYLTGEYSYIDQPLVQADVDGSRSVIVRSLQTLDLRAGFLFNPRWELSVNLPLNRIARAGESPQFKLGDSESQLKYRFTDDGATLAGALIGEISAPTGSEASLLSSGTFGFAVRGALDYDFGYVRVSGNLGLRTNSGARWESVDYRNQMLLGLGLLFPVSARWRVALEGAGALSLPFSAENSPGEYYLGAQYIISPTTLLMAGASLSGFGDGRNDSYRVIAGLKMALVPVRSRPAAGTPAAKGPPRCAVRPVSVAYIGRAPNAAEMKWNEPLPYRYGPTSPNHIETYQLGQMTGMAPGGIPYVNDSQVRIAIDLIDLPKRADVTAIAQSILKMKVVKISQDSTLGTEVLCWQGSRICSGELITSSNYAQTINPEFFVNGARPVNQYFSSQYLSKPAGTAGGETLYSGELTLDIKSLLQGSNWSVEDLLWKGSYAQREAVVPTAAGAPAGVGLVKRGSVRTLYLVVADDTFVSNDVRLELTWSERRCE